MLRILQTDIGSVITNRLAAFAAITAGGAGDGAAVNGVAIDRGALGLPGSALVAIFHQATLAAGQTLSVGAVKVQDSADGASWADFAALPAPGVVATATGGGQTIAKVCLTGARRYVRLVFTADLSAANTDTATLVGAWTFGGFAALPAPT